jgi:hypothetical protein
MRPLCLRLLALVALAGCATTATASQPTHAARAHTPPDVRGDALALLPHGAVAWARVDAAALRASPHFDAGIELARGLGADFAMLERELGFDAIRSAERVAFAIYLPPGESAQGGWPLVYARGRFDREAILTAAAARPDAHGQRSEATEHGLTFTVVGNRAYLFPAPDVMLVMERALVRRVAARLSGESSRTVLTDERFTALWRAAGGMGGPFALAMDLAAMRARMRMQSPSPEAEALDAFVVHGDAPGALTAQAAGTARDANAAHLIVTTIDDARAEVGGQLPVRLLGLSRVLRDGIRTHEDGATVRVEVDATADEVRRLLRATSLLRELTGQSS